MVDNFMDYCYEGYLVNKKDFFYNKDKWDRGEINLCFVTGHSGSGKTTLASQMETDKDTEMYQLDDVLANKENFTMANLKEYGDLIYSFFKGVGKKFYYTKQDVKDGLCKGVDNYDYNLMNEFIDHAISYAKKHKEKKFVIEGVWLYLFIDPSKLTDYAVCIKGTSAWASNWRAMKRDNDNDGNKGFDRIKNQKERFLGFFKKESQMNGSNVEKKLKEWRKYFKGVE